MTNECEKIRCISLIMLSSLIDADNWICGGEMEEGWVRGRKANPIFSVISGEGSRLP